MATNKCGVILLSILTLICSCSAVTPERIFRTSVSFDLLCAPQNFDNLKSDPAFDALANDTVFMQNLQVVNEHTRASKLCNLYAHINIDRNDINSVITKTDSLDILASHLDWAKEILSVQPQLKYVLSALVESGYSGWWAEKIKPELDKSIGGYYISDTLLTALNKELHNFASPEKIDIQSNIYILDIDNAFNLNDETFCCTPLILNPEIEKQLRLNFLNIYIHENCHSLKLTPELINAIDNLKSDSFFAEKETIAEAHGEGKNEAAVVAAEVYISHKIGHRNAQSVYDEFTQYVDGSLVLAPIIYVNMSKRKPNETYNDFLLRLFSDGTISSGHIEQTYNQAMHKIQNAVQE